MPYYRAPAERPRQAKRFLTSREVEDMAAAGQTEIVHVDDMVITDAARETAHDLGVRIAKPGPKAAAVPVALSQRPQPAPPAGAAPALAARADLAVGDPLVQALVHAVRSLKG